jgi:hypothetical protein
MPPAGAAPDRVAVPFDAVNPMTVAGVRLKDRREGGLTVRTADSDAAPTVAVIVIGVGVATMLVFTVNVVDEPP